MMDNSLEDETLIQKKPKFTRNQFPSNKLSTIQVTILIEAEIRPSEDEDLVLKALKNIFPEVEFKESGDHFIGRSNKLNALNHFSKRLLEQEILDAARKIVRKSLKSHYSESNGSDVLEFMVNKQTAYVNKIVFCDIDESPLGPISVKIISPDIQKIIDNYFPKYEWFIN